jgi:hypothetical protein
MSKKKNKSRNPWSLHPSRHRDVLRLLQESGLSFDFYDIDDPFKSTKEYDTDVMGRFTTRHRLFVCLIQSGYSR